LPLVHGFDISVESGTKYLGGHNDLPFGTIACTKDEYEPLIAATAKIYGGSLTPSECYLAERSLKTLFVRVRTQNENAKQVATFLQSHQRIRKVYYPGLPDHPGHSIARQQMAGFGGMISFELDSDAAGAKKFQQHLRLVTPALSLGGVESLISSPMLTSHRYLTADERKVLGISDSLLRLSVGIEESTDIIDDISNALSVL
jgi:cystathionine beta-lyase